jgi:glycosyltransferase involved in cell wall biosynthesis
VKKNTKLVIYAPNVHTGGGLVLLKDFILNISKEDQIFAILDFRALKKIDTENLDVLFWVRPNILSRIKSEILLYLKSTSSYKVFCFHNIPPLLCNSRTIIVYFQNRLILENYSFRINKLSTVLVSNIEYFINFLFYRKVKVYMVQSESIKNLLSDKFQQFNKFRNSAYTPVIEVFPFTHLTSKAKNLAPVNNLIKKFDLIYLSSGESHKNHLKLFEALVILHFENIKPKIIVTIGNGYQNILSKIEAFNLILEGNIINIGEVSHDIAMHYLQSSRALIFPSQCETLGLPLLEAKLLGVPILAPEMDYVRDFCEPTETFNPSSPHSMALSIKRFLGLPMHHKDLPNARSLIDHLLKI